MEEKAAEDVSEEKVLRARTVYVLMKEDYRISRNIRASWYFSNLDTVIPFVPRKSLDNIEDELTVLSVLPHEDDVPDDNQLRDGFKFKLLPHSNIIFLAKRYRIVFVLDLSHSAASVDLRTGEVILNKVIPTLRRCLTGVVSPFILPGTDLLYEPELYVTVIAHTPLLKCTTNQVLAQGIRVLKGNVEDFLAMMKQRYDSFEQNLASEFSKLQLQPMITEDLTEMSDGETVCGQHSFNIPMNPEAGIINLLRQGYFALQLLPENSSAGICVVTDGSLGVTVTDSNRFDALMTQLRNSTIACSFLKMGDTYCARAQFGHIPHVELLQFISTATFGAYFSSCPDLTKDNTQQPNVYHKALLQWSFQKGLEGFRYDLAHGQQQTPVHPTALINKILAHPIKVGPSSVVNPIIRKKHKDMKLNTTLNSVLSVRLREGYTIKDVSITKGGTQIEVRLVLPWREYAKIEYYATASWPLDPSKRQTQVEIMIEGSYDFLHDITCSTRRGVLRTTNVKNFWMALQSLCQADQLLVHLQSFGSSPVHYKLISSIANGIPVFVLPPSSYNPELNSQHNTKDTALNQFASFWNPVVNLDIKIWQKWMHSHRIEMVLEHDVPLPKCLQIPHTTGRFNIIQCRQAFATITTLLREWSSFILIEGLSYVKLLGKDPEKPTSFLLLRSISKPPCIVLRCAFLAGTSGRNRYKTLGELKEKLRNLKFPHRAPQKVDSKKHRAGQSDAKPAVIEHRPPLQLERSEKNCCILLTKPVEQILISYERKPSDMTELEDPSKYIKSHSMTDQQIVTKATRANAFNTLSRYLHHQRWIWSVKRGKVDISMQAIGKILSTLSKIRLQEGFHFASSNSGIVNMVLEVNMKENQSDGGICVVQYIMFPPHVKTTLDSSISEDMDEMETTEADGELQIVTECWIEPQHGISVQNSPERQHWDNMTYKEIAQTFFPVDQECISCMVTFEHLVWVCENNAVFPSEDFFWLYSGSFFGDGPPGQYENKQQEKTTPPNIHQMPFPFDLLSLLPKSQQAEILFSTYMLSSTDEQPTKGSNSILFQLLLDKLSETFDKKVSLSKTDCKRFLELLKKRSRDDLEHPLPFSIDKILSNSTEIPQWCCFVKSVSNNRMFMTILPESFNDLLLLDTKLEVIKEGSSESDEIIDRVTESQGAQTIDRVTESQGAPTESPSAPTESSGVPTESPSAPTESPSTLTESCDAPRDDGQQENKPEHYGKHGKQEEPYHYYTIPFYMYESYLPNVLDMLVNPWDFTLPEDLYEDLTFMESNRDESFSKSPMFKVPSFEREFTPGCDEATMYMSWMRITHERRLTECSNNENEATLKQQCSVLTDIYYSCFVNGVFQSVQQDLCVHKNDVEAAINNICEESLAIETDITTFLLSSCQHFQKIAESAKFDLANRENAIQDEKEEVEEDFFPRRQSVRFNDFVEELDSHPVCGNIPMSLQLPKSTAKLKTSLNYPCEFTEGSHNLVKNKFIDIVQKWFKQVPSNPDYYIYCPVNIPQSVSGEEESDDRNQSDGVLDLSQQDYEEFAFFDDDDLVVVERKQTDHLSTTSMLDSEESYTDEDICEEEKESENIPLFVFFTCTVKHRLDQAPIAVQGLIPCLDEIINKIEIDMEVNLSDLKVTFDINCVTMATDVEEEPKRTFMRMLSNNSTSSSPPLSPREDMMGSSTDLGSLKQTCPDPIKHLPRQQHLAVTKCKEELEWLLRDEIASSLRQLNLIQTDTLEFVTDHIQVSAKKGKPNCSCEHIPLHFVYGMEKSLPNFKEEFERLNLQKYKLMKEEDFYFVVTNKAYNNVLTKALTSALVELSRENTPASLEMIASSTNDVSTAVTYVSPTLMSTEKQKIISPVSHSREDGLSPLPSEKGGLSPLLSGSEESSSAFLKVEGNKNLKSDNDNNDNSTVSEREHFTDFYDKLEGIKTNIRPVKSVDLRSLSAGEIDLQGLKKSSSCAGIIMTSVSTTKEITSLAPPPPVMTWASHAPFLGRPRHFSAPSGQGTPRSKTSTIDHTPSWLSSRASEAGYEGDSSDNEEGDTGFNDLSGSVQQPIPKFWLIMKVISKVKDLGVDVYFHSRETGQEDTEEIIEQRNLVSHVKDSIDKLCCKVNQLLLLNDLYDTRVCKNLLVPEADEDVKWAVDKTVPRGMTQNRGSEDGSEEEEEEVGDQHYLYDSHKWDSGYFDCESVYTKTFYIHSRLKTMSGTRTNTTAIGMQALKSVLNKFSVINRKNMFVIKESTTQAVFYLRLKEVSGKDAIYQRQLSTIIGDEFELGESSASLIAMMKREEMLNVPEKDSDTLSITSSGSAISSMKPQDEIQLFVHGIEPPGKDIREGLVNTLQNKLDDAVLDILSVQLNRNPLSKLSAEDVHFIQKPQEIKRNAEDSKGPMQLQLTIPVSATMQLSAVVYYLKQNLKLFSHIPNYADNRPDSHFQDIMDGRQQAIHDGQAFLYIRPAHGGKGIACISLALVDGKGIPVQALGCRKPSRIGYTKITSEKEFEHLIHTDLYESNGDSRPGPTALLQFRAWEVGSADLGSLKEKLILAVRHSLCDIVTEFTMLTASVCQIPQQLMELLPVASYSTPSSPHAPRESDLQRRHSIMTRKMPDKIVLSSAVSSPLLQSLKDVFQRVTSPTPDQAKSFFDIPSSAAQVQGQPSPSSSLMSGVSSGSEGDIQQIIQKYEEGSRGILNPVFSSLLVKWFDFCHELGVPSVSKDVMALASRFAVDFFLKEFINVVSHILGDVHPKIFKLYKDSEGNLCNGTLYNPCRIPVQTDDVNIESSLDTTDRFDMVMADQDINFVVVGRNTEQWQASVQDFNEEEFTASPTSPKAIPKQTYQRFPPLWSEREKSPDIMNMLASPDPLFIPRQRLLLLTVQNRNLCLYTYNWAGDLNKILVSNVMKLVKWNNNRNTLLNSIISQKMGLFHHCGFSQSSKTKNTELDNLIKHAAPPPNEHLRRKNSNIGQFSASHPSQPFDEAYKDTQPTKPLSQTLHAAIRDVVKCHGLQTQGVRGHVRKDLDAILTLNKMFWSWIAKSSCNEPIYEEDLQLLKQFSRLLHYCATPILFFSQWRQKIMEKYRSTQRLPGTPTPDKTDKSRSRHSSGASTSSLRTKRADSQDGKKRPDSTPTDSPIHGQKQKTFQEEGWHVEIRSEFISEYINYVKSLGFVPINLTANPKKNFRHRKTPSHENFVPDDSHRHGSIGTVKHLQKTMSGGIMLMELSFREQYFCVKLFVCESSRLGTPVNQHDTQHQLFLKVLFVDECEKCKDLIHVHSFAHDFHLRSIQSCISGKGMYKNFYHMTGFLSDFSLVYPYPPAFSRNFLLTDYITFSELSSPAQTLYEHMTRHIKDHGMKVIAMTPTVDADIESEYYFVRTTEYALTQYKEFKVPTRQKSVTDDFDIGLVITNMSQSNVYQTDAEKYTLKLQYFIVLTSKRDLFPVAYLEKKLGQFKTLPQTPEVIPRTSSNPVPVKQHIGVRKQSRRPYKRTNQHQETAENILFQESTMAREKMNELIRQSTAECRKDSLWNRMLIVTHAEEDVKKKKRSDTEESKDGFQKLSHDEFLELLGMVVKQRLADIDPQLMPFHNMSLMWYKSLYKVLQTRYPETHRCFSSPDGHVQYLVVVNPQFPDMLMMLMIDVKDNKTDLCAVFREALSDETDQSKPSLPFINIQDHETDFINVCCFHLWASLL
ncbi:KICSTOR complex protein SZT2-like isoform X3 [Mytilus californianus]|uniref:KICSTOR complex protein SZT2-like isoform X3 n=1 Tax=Mytilus californianus TaxID=6549 RepID=UPI002245895D|nr:KICSTOR complex protein SZT2-like isoform X3 [Mytilus californianus]